MTALLAKEGALDRPDRLPYGCITLSFYNFTAILTRSCSCSPALRPLASQFITKSFRTWPVHRQICAEIVSADRI